MNDLVTQLREERTGYRVTVNDREIFHLSHSDFRAFPLREGEALDFDEYRKNLLYHQYPEALNRAVAMLATRARSNCEVEQRLIARGYLSDTVEMVLYKLEKEHLLNDADFAAAWTQQRAAHGVGKMRLRQELYHKGIESDTVDIALTLVNEDDQQQAAQSLASKLLARHQKETAQDAARKVIAAMQRRGYTYAEASHALRDALEAQQAEDDQ